jgi:hypothetical protein
MQIETHASASAPRISFSAFSEIVGKVKQGEIDAREAWQMLGLGAAPAAPMTPADVAALGLPEGSWKFAVPARSPSKPVHVWGDKDTLCKLGKNKALKPDSYFLADAPGEDRRICQNCIVVARQTAAA